VEGFSRDRSQCYPGTSHLCAAAGMGLGLKATISGTTGTIPGGSRASCKCGTFCLTLSGFCKAYSAPGDQLRVIKSDFHVVHFPWGMSELQRCLV